MIEQHDYGAYRPTLVWWVCELLSSVVDVFPVVLVLCRCVDTTATMKPIHDVSKLTVSIKYMIIENLTQRLHFFLLDVYTMLNFESNDHFLNVGINSPMGVKFSYLVMIDSDKHSNVLLIVIKKQKQNMDA